MPIIIVFGVLGVTAMITQDPPPLYFYNLTLSISFVVAQFIVIVAFLPYINFILPMLHDANSISLSKDLSMIIIMGIIALIAFMVLIGLLRWSQRL